MTSREPPRQQGLFDPAVLDALAPRSRAATAMKDLIGAPVGRGNRVEYRMLGCRSIIGRCRNLAMPFTFTVNPYRGCEIGCRYCYARTTHEYLEQRDPTSFERLIFVKTGASRAAARDLASGRHRGEEIAIGTATDPYQPAEGRFRITRGILETLAEHRGLRISITTKSTLILRDVELLRTLARRSALSINVSLISLDRTLLRKVEPRAAAPSLRLGTLRRLRAAGLEAGLFMMPVLPGLTDHPADVRRLIRAAKRAGAQWVVGEPLFLPPAARQVFLPFLRREFPPHAERMRDRRRASPVDRLRIREMIGDLCRLEGLTPRSPRRHAAEAASAAPRQLSLAF